MKKLTPTGVPDRLCYLLKQSLHSRRFKKTVCAAGLLLFAYALRAQTLALKPLSIGDTVPDIVFTNVYNYPSPAIRLSDLKGKLVILDFWSTWCGSCIEAFPKMEKLQNEFDGLVQFILVNNFEGDDPSRVKTFLTKRKERTGQTLELPYSLLQVSLKEYFPYRFVPHYVWIQGGRVIATTSQFEISKKNIQTVLNGEKVDFHLKKDNIDFNKNKPLFLDGNGGTENTFVLRSILSGYREGLGRTSGIDIDSSGKFTRLYAINYSLDGLLRIAYPEIFADYAANQFMIESAVEQKYFPGSIDKSKSRYTDAYCYDIVTPAVSREEMLSYVREDIYRSFHIKITKEQRLLNCLILSDTHHVFHRPPDKPKDNPDGNKNGVQTILSFTKQLNDHAAFKSLYVINEAIPTAGISAVIPGADASLAQMKDFLKAQGFSLSIEKRLVDVAVINFN